MKNGLTHYNLSIVDSIKYQHLLWKLILLTKNNSFIIEGRLFLSEHCTCNPELYVYGKRMVKPNVKNEVIKLLF